MGSQKIWVPGIGLEQKPALEMGSALLGAGFHRHSFMLSFQKNTIHGGSGFAIVVCHGASGLYSENTIFDYADHCIVVRNGVRPSLFKLLGSATDSEIMAPF